MKKFTRMMALVLLGGSTLVTSCVSEDISPEVENLRQAQVNYLNSKAAMEQAKADNQAAMTAKIQAETALIQAEVELKQAIMQAEADATIAEMQAAVAQAEAEVAAAEQRAAEAGVALQQALDALAAQVNETAQEYLALYQSTINQANSKLNEVASLEGDIARFKAHLDENGNPINLDQLADQLTSEIAQFEAEIATLEANITRLEGVNLNTADVEAELEAVQNELIQKGADMAALQLEYDKAANSFYKLQNAYYGDWWLGRDGAIDLSEDIALYQQDVNYFEGQVSMHEAEVASLAAQLAPFEAELEMTGEGVPAAIDNAEALLEVWIQAEADLMAADINYDAGDTEYDEALVARDEAKTAFIDYAGDYDANYGWSDPKTIADMFRSGYYNPIAGTIFGDILIPYMNVSDNANYNDLKNEYASALLSLNNAENALYYSNLYLSDSQSQLNAILEANDVSNVEELRMAMNEANEAYIYLDAQYTVMTLEIEALENLMFSLQDYLNGVPASMANAIEDMQWQIEMLKEDISENEAALADNAISQEEWDARIAREEQKLEHLTAQYNALVALANDYLEQFNEVVEN